MRRCRECTTRHRTEVLVGFCGVTGQRVVELAGDSAEVLDVVGRDRRARCGAVENVRPGTGRKSLLDFAASPANASWSSRVIRPRCSMSWVATAERDAALSRMYDQAPDGSPCWILRRHRPTRRGARG